MAVNPVRINELSSALQKQSAQSAKGVTIPFKDYFEEAIKNVKETEAQARLDAINAVAGNMDDLHTLAINVAKAELALSLFVGLRNKALEAYNEIMRITL